LWFITIRDHNLSIINKGEIMSKNIIPTKVFKPKFNFSLSPHAIKRMEERGIEISSTSGLEEECFSIKIGERTSVIMLGVVIIAERIGFQKAIIATVYRATPYQMSMALKGTATIDVGYLKKYCKKIYDHYVDNLPYISSSKKKKPATSKNGIKRIAA
jgi:hypothetical protein